MPITYEQAKQLIADEMREAGDRSPGWDGRLNSAILVVFGDGKAHDGRVLLAKMAAKKIHDDAAEK